MKESLSSLVSDKSIRLDHNASTLILSVLLKYGIAPIACIYLGYILMQKDITIEKHSEIMLNIVREQTLATTKQTSIMENLDRNIQANTKKLDEVERRLIR
jgi:hypothetical protein